jgi:(heptosyl)LPS beta-1,4-glucosyltransferase
MANSLVTVLIYAYNDEENIKRAVDSAKLLSSNIVLIDIGSIDKTAEVAKKSGASIVTLKQLPYVELARMDGVKHAKTEWIFILDSDEVISQDLANEILSVTTSQSQSKSADSNEFQPVSTRFTSYRVPRKNLFGPSKWLRHGGWWPDLQTRLIKKSALQDWPKIIHSTPKIEGESADLKEALLHYSHGDFSQMVHKTIKFEGTESELLHKAGRRASTLIFFRKFLGELYRRLIKQKGFLDGKEGFAESIYQAYSKTVTYLMLYEKSR